MDPNSALPGRVLVVDDQENICWVLAKLLSERNHVVRTAHTGAAALSALATFDCHVAVVDYRLPDRDGCSLIQEMTRRVPGLRAILMTSYGSASLREIVSQGGAYAYFDKPFKNSAIIRVVEEAIDAYRQGADSLAREASPGNGFPFDKKPDR
jgi:DNA-binding NtrC family response regulator